MTKIVILGAGFGGLTAALGLEKKFRNRKDISITLIDRHDYQQFNFNLYEVATAEEEFTSIDQLKAGIALPLKKLLVNSSIKFLQGEVKEIDPQKKVVSVGNKQVEYNYLVCAMGSQTDYFNIEGAEKFALPLKSLKDALRIRNQIEFAVAAHKLDVNKKNINIVVAGGGYTGVEFAAEAVKIAEIVAWKNNYPLEKIEITLVETASELIPGFSKRLSRDVHDRLRHLGVRVRLSCRIVKAANALLEISDGEQLAYDVLVWTTGIKANPLNIKDLVLRDSKNRCLANPYLQLAGHHEIFILGDQACINCNGKPAACSAHQNF
jgi:NADH dehydrogenase